MDQKVYRPGEFAALLGVHIKTLQKWDRSGALKARRTAGGRRYYTEGDYERYLGCGEDGLPLIKRIDYTVVDGDGAGNMVPGTEREMSLLYNQKYVTQEEADAFLYRDGCYDPRMIRCTAEQADFLFGKGAAFDGGTDS